MSYAYNDALYSIQTDICKYNGNCKVRRLAYVIKKGGHGFLQNDALPRGWGECFTGLRVIEADLDERSDH